MKSFRGTWTRPERTKKELRALGACCGFPHGGLATSGRKLLSGRRTCWQLEKVAERVAVRAEERVAVQAEEQAAVQAEEQVGAPLF